MANRSPHFTAFGAAVLFGLSTPLAKMLLRDISPLALAGCLYLGAFSGLVLFEAGRRLLARSASAAAALTSRDLPWLFGAVIAGGVIGPAALLFGLDRLQGVTASLLLNLEAPATAILAVLLFREQAGRRLWIALSAMTGAGVFLSWNPASGSFAWSGALLILAAMTAWGLDNNLTRVISGKDAVRIAQIKGLVAGTFAWAAALALGQRIPSGPMLVYGLALGAAGYGLSLVLYIRALAGLGAFRAGAVFSAAPFVGALASLAILGDRPSWTMGLGALLMLFGAWSILGERHAHPHRHPRVVHTHRHRHDNGHHDHDHEAPAAESHSHGHVHEEGGHSHGHWPDLHHRHGH
ncbi:MAG: DMT family transporter [Candidatus Aminicenantes bacterium]|nr:DMT family transporter [Candidatus Aminicenantes bacterium]